MEHAKEERENLGAHDVNVGDAKEYFQEAAAELELKTVLLERRLARAKDVEEDEATRVLQDLVNSLGEEDKASALTKEEISGASYIFNCQVVPSAHRMQNSVCAPRNLF